MRPQTFAMDLQSRRSPSSIPEDSSWQTTRPVLTTGPGVPHLGYPAIFANVNDSCVEEWLATCERINAYKKWFEAGNLSSVRLHLAGVVSISHKNDQVEFLTWFPLKNPLADVFSLAAVRRLSGE
ncbi:hypothetical protein HPB50_022310 [Hyalomma asiaticum]|uniref:Uncharacterized protein n=1 Tax=Hyalomma asiaticum TaxID=266040 RepID=A0ACB7T489_HYAAI|nr:hypothetical protein HPB50_022310 [Hyalomma asiaticum]